MKKLILLALVLFTLLLCAGCAAEIGSHVDGGGGEPEPVNIAFIVGMLAQFFVNRRFMGFMLLALAALLLTALVQTTIVALKSAGSFSAIWTALLQTLWSLPFAALVYFPPARWIE